MIGDWSRHGPGGGSEPEHWCRTPCRATGADGVVFRPTQPHPAHPGMRSYTRGQVFGDWLLVIGPATGLEAAVNRNTGVGRHAAPSARMAWSSVQPNRIPLTRACGPTPEKQATVV